ncbi:MAG: excinuclease ABC subunit UvrC [Clostridia bacterium]
MNEIILQKVKNLPLFSGVYIMRDITGKIIYVGKAKNLKNRISQYFNNSHKHIKVKAMVDKIADFDFLITPSELDAFALESNLIKKYMPFYNILLKDGKQFPYIKIDIKDEFPRISVVRKVLNDNAKYFGPYIQGVSPSKIVNMISGAFGLRTCLGKLTKKPKRECLNFFLGLCSAPCTKKESADEYKKRVEKAMDFLKGNTLEIKKYLTEKMNVFAKNENFERAIDFREQFEMIKKMESHVVASLSTNLEADVFCYHSNGICASIATMFVRNGKIIGVFSQSVLTDVVPANEIVASFINQYYENAKPSKQIYVNIEPFEKQGLEKILAQKLTSKVHIIVPQKGVGNSLIQMAKDNAKNHLEKFVNQEMRKNEKLAKGLNNLQKLLNLPEFPRRIEWYDISNIGGTNQVASMIVFVDGLPCKKEYRKFKIKTVDGANDFASMEETLERRLKHLNEDNKFQRPNLILIDGGKGQLSSAVSAMKKVGMHIPIISLAEKFDEVFVQNSKTPVMLERNSAELILLQNGRDEAHRFAITFHRNLRSKSMLNSALDNIEGIGKKRKEILLQNFKTVENIKKANIIDLKKIGLSATLAKKVLDKLN